MATIRGAPRKRRAHDARQPDAAQADDDHRRAGFDRGGLEHRADPGRDAVPEERGDRGSTPWGRGWPPLPARPSPRPSSRCRNRRGRLAPRRRQRPRRRAGGAPRSRPAAGAGTRASRAGPGPARDARTARPYGTSHDRATGWPTRSERTPGPTASTTPCALVTHRDRCRAQIAVATAGRNDRRRTRGSAPGRPARGPASSSDCNHGRLAGRLEDRRPDGRRHSSCSRRRSSSRTGVYGT